jgi:histidinol phosphatase-like enzyme
MMDPNLLLPPPLPGTELPPKALFVGRWGALLQRPKKGVCTRFSDAQFSPGALPLLFRAGQSGWKLYLIGNEEAVATGRMAESAWERFEADLLAHLSGQGIGIARHYACLDHVRGKGRRRRDSVFQFPNTGALYHAAQEDGIDLHRSWLVGDDAAELAAGWRAGCRVLRLTPTLRRPEDPAAEADIVAPDLATALRELLSAVHART